MTQRPESLTIQEDQAAMRLDLFLTKQFTEYTRSYWTNMISHSYVSVNRRAVKPGYILRHKDKVHITWPSVTREFADKVVIIYESDNVLVIDKPAGMLVHSKGQFNPEFTVSDFALEHGAFTGSDRPGVVHRLDRQTSGVMILAKNQASLTFLQKQFADRHVDKRYIAVVEGNVTDMALSIRVPLARNPKKPKTFRADPAGKTANTDFRVVKQLPDKTVVAAMPVTGRTHQIRVHLSHIGHPIVGDTQYGSKTELQGQRFLLHSTSLRLILPGKSRRQTFFAPIPADMTSYVHADDLAAID